MFISIQDLLPQISRKKGMLNIMQSSSTCKKAQDTLNALFENQNFSPQVKSLKNTKLKISCKNSSELHEISMYKSQILKEFENSTYGKKITDIFFTLDG